MTQSGERLGSDRTFGLVFAAVFALVGLYLLKAETLRYWALAIAVAFTLAALARPRSPRARRCTRAIAAR